MYKSDNLNFRVDVTKIIRAQHNHFIKKLPDFTIKIIKRIVREKELNEIVEYAEDYSGIEFIAKCMEYLNISYIKINENNIPDFGRFIFVCNHPQGGIDYFAAILSIYDKHPNIKTLANEILMSVTPIKDFFIPVNVFGKNSEKNKTEILKNMASDNVQILTFPSGEVAGKINGKLDDGKWHRSFVRYAVEHKRDVIPVFIDTENSNKFYTVFKIRKFLRIKANLELFLLPQELIKQKNKTIKVYFGKPVKYTSFNEKKSFFEWSEYIKKIVYELK